MNKIHAITDIGMCVIVYNHEVQGRLVYKDAPHGGDYLWDGWRETKFKRLKG